RHRRQERGRGGAAEERGAAGGRPFGREDAAANQRRAHSRAEAGGPVRKASRRRDGADAVRRRRLTRFRTRHTRTVAAKRQPRVAFWPSKKEGIAEGGTMVRQCLMETPRASVFQ